MLKIKVFDETNEKDLEKNINNFIKDISNQEKEVIDIKYSTSVTMTEEVQIYCFSALVMYDDKICHTPKKWEVIEKC